MLIGEKSGKYFYGGIKLVATSRELNVATDGLEN